MASQAKPSSSSSGSSPLLKISGERTSLLHEDDLTPKNSSESGSFSGDKVTICLQEYCLQLHCHTCTIDYTSTQVLASIAAGSQKCCRTLDNLHFYVFVCKIW